MSRAERQGAALLEVLIALAILASVGAAAVALATDATRTVTSSRESEAQMRRASAFLDAVAQWPRQELDLRLGDRRQGPWFLRIDRPVSTLYVVSLTDTASGRELFSTALYRPEPLTRAGPHVPR